MPAIALLASTGVARIDRVVRESIELIEQHLPERVRGYYLVGSHAYGEALPASDIDLLVLLKQDLADEDRQRFEAAREACRRSSALPIDLSLDSEAKFFRVGGVWFQTASLLLYGQDIRSHIPRKPVANHIRDLLHAVCPLLARVRGDPMPLTFPLRYPNPTGILYGYDARYRERDEAQRTATKDLVTNVLAAANALTLLAAQRYVGSGRKSDIPHQYAIWIGGEWQTLVEEVFVLCRIRWGYHLPYGEADLAQLRSICQQVLRFENMFLERYRDWLLAELRSDDLAAQLLAVQRLGKIVYPDPAVAAALAAVAAHGRAEIQPAVMATLQHYQPFTSP